MNLEAFTQVQMEGPSCMLSLSQGTEYAVDYQLTNSYEVVALGVENGTFFFQCKHRYPIALFHWDWKKNYVHLTVPPDVTLDSVCIRNTSGPIEVNGIRASRMEAHNVSGSLSLNGVSAGLLLAKSISGAIKLANCAAGEMESSNVSGVFDCEQLSVTGSLRCQNTSGAIRITGEVRGGLDAMSTSGSIHGSGLLLGNLDLKTTSGGIELNLDLPAESCSYSLHSVSGGRKVNGQKADSALSSNASAMVTGHTVSGGIKLNFLQ